MSIPGSVNPLFLGAAGQATGAGGYLIERSLRFNSSDSAYLLRVFPGNGTDLKIRTFACWVKRSGLGDIKEIFSNYGVGVHTRLAFDSDQIYIDVAGAVLVTTQVFRDVSAWYHIMLAWDTTQGTSSERVKLYVNGLQVTTFSTTNYPTLNANTYFASTSGNSVIGQYQNIAGYVIDGYLADIHFIDGQALDPTSFGEFDDNGIWQPKAYSGDSYGTNGFHLDFADNSSNTATTLGKDTSPNGNNWTPNNLSAFNVIKSGAGSVTAGAPFNSSFPWTTAFDGAIDLTGAVSNASGANSFVWTFANTLTGTTAAFVVHDTYVPDFDTGNKAAINGTALTSANWTKTTNTLPVASGAPGDYKVYTFSLGGSPLSTVGVGNAVRIAAVLLDGVPLVVDFAGTNDSLVDVPTNGAETDTGAGGEVRGNYCTWNPVARLSEINFNLTNGNLDFSQSSSLNAISYATFALDSGKWYWEVAHTALADANYDTATYIATDARLSQTASPRVKGVAYLSNGNKKINDANTSYGSSYTTGDVIGIALDADSNSVTYYKNGVSQGAISLTYISGYCPAVLQVNGSLILTGSVNFGQRAFAYTAPSGFKALNTANLPAPVVTNPSTVMDVALYTGNGGNQSITLPGGFNPDLVWVKSRSNSQDHYLFDAIRGGAGILRSNTAGAETTGTTYLSFDTSGFSSLNGLSSNGYTYAAWAWDAGSSTVTNTVGSISSQVRANASAGFSVVTYTGTGSSATVGHGLGVAPSWIIIKNRTTSYDWIVYVNESGTLKQLYLSLTLGSAGAGLSLPSSTTFNLGGGGPTGSNANADTYVCYAFSPVAGYSAFGSYTGNGSTTDNTFVYTGMRPRFVMLKRSDSTGNWVIWDAVRNSYNVANSILLPNSSDAEFSPDAKIDILSNGFKVRDNSGDSGTNGATYIYAAWAEHPFNYSRAR